MPPADSSRQPGPWLRSGPSPTAALERIAGPSPASRVPSSWPTLESTRLWPATSPSQGIEVWGNRWIDRSASVHGRAARQCEQPSDARNLRRARCWRSVHVSAPVGSLGRGVKDRPPPGERLPAGLISSADRGATCSGGPTKLPRSPRRPWRPGVRTQPGLAQPPPFPTMATTSALKPRPSMPIPAMPRCCLPFQPPGRYTLGTKPIHAVSPTNAHPAGRSLSGEPAPYLQASGWPTLAQRFASLCHDPAHRLLSQGAAPNARPPPFPCNEAPTAAQIAISSPAAAPHCHPPAAQVAGRRGRVSLAVGGTPGSRFCARLRSARTSATAQGTLFELFLCPRAWRFVGGSLPWLGCPGWTMRSCARGWSLPHPRSLLPGTI